MQDVLGKPGKTVALSLRIGALGEDCGRADVLLSAIPVRRGCDGPELIIDRFDVFRNGATALSFEEARIRIETVRARDAPVVGPRRRRSIAAHAGHLSGESLAVLDLTSQRRPLLCKVHIDLAHVAIGQSS